MENGSMSCLLMTTNAPHRMQNLERCYQYILQNYQGKINELVITVDILPKYPFDVKDFDKFVGAKNGLGIKIIYGKGGSKQGMVMNQIRGLKSCKNEWVLIIEEKAVLYDIPNISDLLCLPNFSVLLYNCHFNDILTQKHIDYMNDRSNYFFVKGGLCLKKNKSLSDKWIICFPSAIIKRDLLLKIHDYALKNFHGDAIEVGVGKAWQIFDPKGEIYMYIKPEFLFVLPLSFKIDIIGRDFVLHKYSLMGYRNNHNNDTLLQPQSLENQSHIWY